MLLYDANSSFPTQQPPLKKWFLFIGIIESVNLSRYTRTASQGRGPVKSSSLRRESTDQKQINQSILTQLNAISDRLTKI